MKFPRSAFLAITFRCNSRCLMCDIWKKKSREELSPDDYKKLPSSLREIDITGGEPFLRNDLLKIIKVLKEVCPKAKMLITTNGLLPKRINEMVPKMLETDKNLALRISLDGMGRVHDKIRGIPKAFDKAMETLKALKKLEAKDIGIVFTLMKKNKDELPKILDLCKKEKLNFSLNLVHESPIYFGEKKRGLRPNPKEIKESLEEVSRFFIPSLVPRNWAKGWFYKRLSDYAAIEERPIKCGAGENFFYLDPYGDVYLCHFKNWKIGNLKKQFFEEIWQEKKRKELLKFARKCHDCFMICTVKDEIRRCPLSLLK